MDMVETSVWSGKGTQWSDRVALYFGPLTLETLMSSVAYVGIHTWSNEMVRDESLGSMYAWMRKGKERVKHCAAE